MLISGSRARVSGHLHAAFERVRHCLGRYISRVYRIPPRAARTAGVISSVYAPSGSKRDTAFALHRTHRHTPRAALKRDTAFAMHPYRRYTPRAALKRDTAFAMHLYPTVYAPSGSKRVLHSRCTPYPSVYAPSSPKTGYCTRDATVPDGISPERL